MFMAMLTFIAYSDCKEVGKHMERWNAEVYSSLSSLYCFWKK